jgi:hypothetical protein
MRWKERESPSMRLAGDGGDEENEENRRPSHSSSSSPTEPLKQTLEGRPDENF